MNKFKGLSKDNLQMILRLSLYKMKNKMKNKKRTTKKLKNPNINRKELYKEPLPFGKNPSKKNQEQHN